MRGIEQLGQLARLITCEFCPPSLLRLRETDQTLRTFPSSCERTVAHEMK